MALDKPHLAWYAGVPVSTLPERPEQLGAATAPASTAAAAREPSVPHAGRQYEAEHRRQRSAPLTPAAQGRAAQRPPHGGDGWGPGDADGAKQPSKTIARPPVRPAGKRGRAAARPPLSPREQVDMIRLLRQEQRHPQRMTPVGRAQLQDYRQRVAEARGRKTPRGARSGVGESGAGQAGVARQPGPTKKERHGRAGAKKGGLAHPGAEHARKHGKAPDVPRPARASTQSATIPSPLKADRQAAGANSERPQGDTDQNRQQPLEKVAAELLAVVDEIRNLLKQAVGSVAPPPSRPAMPPANTVAMPSGAMPNSLALAAQRKAAIGSSV